MRSLFRLLTALSLAVSSLAVLSPTQSSAAGAPAAAQTARPTLSITNRSGQEIEELYVSSVQSAGWGDDRLSDKTLARNATFRVRLTEGCVYDIQVVYADNRTEERMRVDVCRVPAQTFTAAQAHAPPAVPTREFTLDNRSPRTITSVTVADTADEPGNEDWGDNLLDTHAPPGTQAHLSFNGECRMAVRVQYDNGAAEQRRDVDLCAGDKQLAITPGWTTQDEPGPGAPAPDVAGLVTVTNRGQSRMTELFLYPDDAAPDDEARRDDRLGNRVVDPGADVQVALQRDGKCLFTLRGVFANHLPDQVQTGLDFCPRTKVDIGAP